jgi:TRAP-type C4-dicarboxylate transport system permease small subunit
MASAIEPAAPDRAASPDDGAASPGDRAASPGDGDPFHVTDQPIDLSVTPVEGWISLGLFWLLGLTVLHQFVTRYVFNDAAAWTEEIARYLLIGVVFVGASVAVYRNNHIQVDFLYRYLPPRFGRVLSLAVDVLRLGFFVTMVLLLGQMMRRLGSYEMTVVAVPMNAVYGVCELGLVMMAWRSARVLWQHYQRGYSALERPGGA